MQPFWLERQTDVTGPDFIPGSNGPDAVNVTHRNWSLVGTVATPDRGVVDPRGLVTPTDPHDGGGWSLDWWVGADDRWHTPSSDAGVRQRLVGDAPVIETSMRIPGGDAVQRVYAIHASTDSPFGQAYLIVEIENASAVPFALALAVRPYNPLGPAAVRTITLVGAGPEDTAASGAGACLVVNGAPGVLLPRQPARVAGATAAAGEVADLVFSGLAGSELADLDCPAGGAQAAVIFPLPHTAVLRVALPIGRPVRPRRRSSGETAPRMPAVVPTAEQVAKGWETQTRRGMRISVPDPSWQRAFDVGRSWLLVAHGGEDLASWPERPLDWVEAASVLGALDEQGFGEESAQVLATWAERQALDGSLVHPGGTAAANGAALVALARHVELTGDVDSAERLVGPVAKAVHWIDKRCRSRRGAPPLTAEELEWSWRGLGAAAGLLDRIGQPEVAADARRFAEVVRSGLDAAAPPDVESSGDALVDPHGAGLDTQRTVALARAEVAAGEPRALDRLAWALSVASPTSTWPEVVHPRTLGGSAGDGHHTATGAEVLRMIRDLVVRETSDGVALCSLLPESWRGQGIEVHDAPTAWGRLSFAVRWHGERPALLWDLDPHPGTGGAVLRAPGLDPQWWSTEARGEALLAGVEPIGESPPEPGASFS